MRAVLLGFAPCGWGCCWLLPLLVGNRLLALPVALLGLVGAGENFNSQLFADQWRALLPAAGYVVRSAEGLRITGNRSNLEIYR